MGGTDKFRTYWPRFNFNGMSFYLQIVIRMTVNNCDSQSALHMQEIYSHEWSVLCVMNDDACHAPLFDTSSNLYLEKLRFQKQPC